MSEQKRYTAQEMREEAKQCKRLGYYVAEAMLRQAADSEEELEQLKVSKDRWMQYQETAAGERNACIDELRKKDAEIAQLKAKLETVVKYAEENVWDESGEKSAELDTCTKIHNHDMNAILNAARGDGVAE